MKLTNKGVGRIKYLENPDRIPCRASYSYDGSLYIPYVDAASGILTLMAIILPLERLLINQRAWNCF